MVNVDADRCRRRSLNWCAGVRGAFALGIRCIPVSRTDFPSHAPARERGCQDRLANPIILHTRRAITITTSALLIGLSRNTASRPPLSAIVSRKFTSRRDGGPSRRSLSRPGGRFQPKRILGSSHELSTSVSRLMMMKAETNTCSTFCTTAASFTPERPGEGHSQAHPLQTLSHLLLLTQGSSRRQHWTATGPQQSDLQHVSSNHSALA